MTETRRSQMSGQTLPLFAIMMPGLLALMALGLDSAQIFLERREAQGAADLAALAGVRSLPDSPTGARTDATTIGVAHGFPQASVVPVTPYDGDDTQIEVTVHSSVDTFFMGIFGRHTVDVSARAVAQADWTEGTTAAGGYAIFALETSCATEKSVDISGSDDNFFGRVHSNSDVYVSGSNNDFNGETTYVCGFHDGGDSNSFDSTEKVAEEQDPLKGTTWSTYCPASSGEGFNGSSDWDLSSDGAWWVGGSKDSKRLMPGVYCSSGLIKLGDSDITVEDVDGMNGITWVADKIEVSGSNFQISPHVDENVLFAAFSSEPDALKLAGSGGDWAGLLYAPNGVAELSGQALGQDDFNLTGGIIADRVKLNGSDSYIDGTIGEGAAADPTQEISLVE